MPSKTTDRRISQQSSGQDNRLVIVLFIYLDYGINTDYSARVLLAGQVGI